MTRGQKAKTIRERDVERYLVQQVKLLGGEVRKVRWIGRTGAPDRVVMLDPERAVMRLADATGCYTSARGLLFELIGMVLVWPELKAPGVLPEPHQMREHTRMRRMGQRVEVVDSFAAVDHVLGINHKLKGDK